MAKLYKTFVIIALAEIAFSSCSSKKPHSGGKPYEVTIITNDEASGRVLMREMSGCTEYYTADEKMFSLSLTKDNGAMDAVRMARTLIITDTAEVKQTSVVTEKDLWAAPQLVIYIKTPSARQMAKDFKDLREKIAQKINDFERDIMLQQLLHKRNMMLEDSVIRYTGTRMYVPATMKIARKADSFIWLTAFDADENQSLCIYRTHKKNADVNYMPSITAFRDSIMREHVKGATDSAEWQICRGTERIEKRGGTFIVRNRWEMTGDAMGGPSACRIIEHGDSITFVEAFLYAPASKKRIRMQKLEGILHSIGLK